MAADFLFCIQNSLRNVSSVDFVRNLFAAAFPSRQSGQQHHSLLECIYNGLQPLPGGHHERNMRRVCWVHVQVGRCFAVLQSIRVPQSSQPPLSLDTNATPNTRQCGGTSEFCGSGCQSEFGSCRVPNATLGNPPCSWAGEGTSPRCDGRCGSQFNGSICNEDAGPNDFARYGVYQYGQCCSSSG
ncbi:hypothetical protein BKA81DRAFT_378489 [Phyllosticta paracitricarpa]